MVPIRLVYHQVVELKTSKKDIWFTLINSRGTISQQLDFLDSGVVFFWRKTLWPTLEPLREVWTWDPWIWNPFLTFDFVMFVGDTKHTKLFNNSKCAFTMFMLPWKDIGRIVSYMTEIYSKSCLSLAKKM